MNEDLRVSLYNILDAKDFIERIKAEDDAELEEYSKSIAIQEANKVNAIAGFLRETELAAENAEIESKRLSEIAKFYANRAERIRQSMKYAMEAHGIEKIETDKFRVSFRKSESVEVDDVEQLPEQFVVIKRSADKKAIKEALKSGDKLKGVRVVVKNNLQIK